MATLSRQPAALWPATVRYVLFWSWVLLSAVCVLFMWAYPGDEVLPFHLIWIGFALAYGFEPWPVALTFTALGVATAAAGSVLVLRASAGVIAWEETAEILLMLLLAALIVWHVRSRQAALATVTRIADHQVAVSRARERLARLTSHEMRTPLTIASGYVDLLLAREERGDHRDDLAVVRDELGRLVRAGDRLVRMIQMEDHLPHEPVDLALLIDETVTRWAMVARRKWVTEAAPAQAASAHERLRACLDTLIENAVRYTHSGDTIRVFSRTEDDDTVWLGVADSGPGFTARHIAIINDAHPVDPTDDFGIGAAGPAGQTGYGLGIVREIVTAQQGLVRAGMSREGGALVVIVLPSA